MWTANCEVTLSGTIIVFGIVSILWLFGRLYLGLAVLYFFAMFWVYTLNQGTLIGVFGPYALGWYGGFSTLLLAVITAIVNLFPDRH